MGIDVTRSRTLPRKYVIHFLTPRQISQLVSVHVLTYLNSYLKL